MCLLFCQKTKWTFWPTHYMLTKALSSSIALHPHGTGVLVSSSSTNSCLGRRGSRAMRSAAVLSASLSAELCLVFPNRHPLVARSVQTLPACLGLHWYTVHSFPSFLISLVATEISTVEQLGTY